MAAKEVKKRSITAKLVPNKLTDRDDDYTCNVTCTMKEEQTSNL